MNHEIANMIVGGFVVGSIGGMGWFIKNVLIRKPPELVEVKECELRRQNMVQKIDNVEKKVDTMTNKLDEVRDFLIGQAQ